MGRRWTFDPSKLNESDARVQEPRDPEPTGRLPNFHPPIRPIEGRDIQEHIELYKLSEAAIFNLLVAEKGGIAPYRYLDVTGGDGAVIGSRDIGVAAWACIYLGKLLAEDSRPLVWITKAQAKLRELADYLLSQQCGSPTEDSNITNTIGTTGPNDTEYGGFPRLQDSPVTLLGSVYSEDVGTCGLALLYAYQRLGDIKYRNGYRAAVTCLRRLQQGGKLQTQYAASAAGMTAGDGRYHSGAWAHKMDITDPLGQGGGAQGQGGAYGIALTSFNVASDLASIAMTGPTPETQTAFWMIDYGSLPGTRMRVVISGYFKNQGAAHTVLWRVSHTLLDPGNDFSVLSFIPLGGAGTQPLQVSVTEAVATYKTASIDIPIPTDNRLALVLTYQSPDAPFGTTADYYQNNLVIWVECY